MGIFWSVVLFIYLFGVYKTFKECLILYKNKIKILRLCLLWPLIAIYWLFFVKHKYDDIDDL